MLVGTVSAYIGTNWDIRWSTVLNFMDIRFGTKEEEDEIEETNHEAGSNLGEDKLMVWLQDPW